MPKACPYKSNYLIHILQNYNKILIFQVLSGYEGGNWGLRLLIWECCKTKRGGWGVIRMAGLDAVVFIDEEILLSRRGI